jgi:hypothetical protein
VNVDVKAHVHRRCLFSLLMFASPLVAQEGTWNKVDNIRQAAADIRVAQKERGFFGAQAEVRACYDEAKQPSKSYGREIERCVTQDYVLSQAAASLYASVSPEARRLSNSPEPGVVIESMAKRIVEAMAHFRVPERDARQFIALVKEHGLPAFMNEDK